MSEAESAVPSEPAQGEIDSLMPNADNALDQVVQHAPNPEGRKATTQASMPASIHWASASIEYQHHTSGPPTATSTSPLQSDAHVFPAAQDEDESIESVHGEKDSHHNTVTSSIVRPFAPLHSSRTNSPRRSLAARTASRSPVRSGSPSTSYIKPTPPPSPRIAQASLSPPPTGVLSSLRKSLDGAVESLPDNMLFGQSAERRRRAMATTSALTDYEADLTGKDRTKQKAAIQKYLGERVKADWTWEWPRTKEPDEDSVRNIAISLDAEEMWKERDDWTDDNPSDGEPETELSLSPPSPDRPDSAISKAISKSSPFRFESPDGVGELISRKERDRKRRRKQRLAEEIAVNEGLKCYVQRRDAWTGARRVPSHRAAKVRSVNRDSSVAENGSSTAVDSEDPDNENIESEWEYDTEIPIAPPILPKENVMRSSIGPNAYNTIYDKVVLQSLSPSCPINLKDIMNSCIQGWQRDGEWYPPKQQGQDGLQMPVGLLHKKRRKGSLAGMLGLTPDGSRRDSLSPKSPGFGGKIKKVLGLGKGHEKDEAPENNHLNLNGNDNGGTVQA